MGFSITSAVIGGVLIIGCSIYIMVLENYDAEMPFIVIMLVLGTVEFVIGIVTSITQCSCLMKPCPCCSWCDRCLVRPQQVLCQPLYPHAGKKTNWLR